MSRINKKGRNRSPPFVMIYHSLTASPAWLDLSGNAVKLLVHMVKLSNGINNGEIVLSAAALSITIGHQSIATTMQTYVHRLTSQGIQPTMIDQSAAGLTHLIDARVTQESAII